MSSSFPSASIILEKRFMSAPTTGPSKDSHNFALTIRDAYAHIRYSASANLRQCGFSAQGLRGATIPVSQRALLAFCLDKGGFLIFNAQSPGDKASISHRAWSGRRLLLVPAQRRSVIIQCLLFVGYRWLWKI